MSGMNQALLVELSISTWDARKSDKRVTGDVVRDNDAKTSRAVNVVKRLFADEPKLANITGIAASIRQWHYSKTLPWSDRGTRLLPMTGFLEYKREYAEWEAKFHDAVREFVTEYPTLISAAAFRLGDLFQRADYPSQTGITRRFSLGCTFSPVPESGDFRVDAQADELEELRTAYEEKMAERLAQANEDVWRRLHDVITRMSTQFDFDGGRRKRLVSTLYTSARDVLGVMDTLNVTGDADLAEARKGLADILYDGMLDDAKKSETVRANIKRQVDTFRDKWAGRMAFDDGEDENEEVGEEVSLTSTVTGEATVEAAIEEVAEETPAEKVVADVLSDWDADEEGEEEEPGFPVPTPEYDAPRAEDDFF